MTVCVEREEARGGGGGGAVPVHVWGAHGMLLRRWVHAGPDADVGTYSQQQQQPVSRQGLITGDAQ